MSLGESRLWGCRVHVSEVRMPPRTPPACDCVKPLTPSRVPLSARTCRQRVTPPPQRLHVKGMCPSNGPHPVPHVIFDPSGKQWELVSEHHLSVTTHEFQELCSHTAQPVFCLISLLCTLLPCVFIISTFCTCKSGPRPPLGLLNFLLLL